MEEKINSLVTIKVLVKNSNPEDAVRMAENLIANVLPSEYQQDRTQIVSAVRYHGRKLPKIKTEII